MTKDDKSNSKSGKGSSHPDFDELLKQEQERMKSVQPDEDSEPQLDGTDQQEQDLLKDHEDLSAELDDILDSNEFDQKNIDIPAEPKLEPKENKEAHEEELKDLAHALSEEDSVVQQSSQDLFEEQFGAFDDSTEFNIDDDDQDVSEEKIDPVQSDQKSPKKTGGFLSLLSGGLVFYVLIAVIVLGGGYLIFDMIFSHHRPVQHKQVVQQHSYNHNVGFHPVEHKVVPQKPKLPPAIPQTLPQANTVVMGNTPSEILGSRHQGIRHVENGVTLLQISKAQLAKLLDNFQKVVKANNAQVAGDVHTLKSSLSSINASQNKTAAAYTQKLMSINEQIRHINQKFDLYNKHMKSINEALTKTQAQLKLILAERAQNIQRYTLRAVVPGRAWLVNDAGKTITLKLGQSLRDYGKVVEVNDKMGYVKMSSGFVFK